MKKLAITMVAVACAGMVSAQVYSQNVVGYSKETLQMGFNMVRTPFVDGGQTAQDIQNIFDTSVLLQGATAGTADNIFFWDNGSSLYASYFLHDGSGKNNAAKAGKWVDAATTVDAGLTVGLNEGFFYVRNGGAISLPLSAPYTLD